MLCVCQCLYKIFKMGQFFYWSIPFYYVFRLIHIFGVDFIKQLAVSLKVMDICALYFPFSADFFPFFFIVIPPLEKWTLYSDHVVCPFVVPQF